VQGLDPQVPESEELVERFRSYLVKQGMKFTRPRRDILLTFFGCEGHVSAEELHQLVRQVNRSIGLATVHRTVKVLVEAGFAQEHTFGGKFRRYERSLRKSHHDHLICSECGKIFEFEEPRIEELQEEVARCYGFTIREHRLDLYGVCDAFREGRLCPHREARLQKQKPKEN
jgi:Fur family ferric uptake transcriptional regulator